MPRPLPLIPNDPPALAAAAPLLLELDQQDAFANTLSPGTWTIPLLRFHKAGALRLDGLCRTQLWLIQALGIPDRERAWSILNLTLSMAQVDHTGLSPACFDALALHALQLHRAVFSGRYRTVQQLRTAADARAVTAAATCAGSVTGFPSWLGAAADALVPHLFR